MDYVHAHLTEPLAIGQIAAAAGVGGRPLHRAFLEHLGVAPMAYVRRLRLDRARQDLLDGLGSVTDVALRWGFLNLSRFAELYRRAFGETPSSTQVHVTRRRRV